MYAKLAIIKRFNQRNSMDAIVKLIDTIQQYIISCMCVLFTTTFLFNSINWNFLNI